MPLLALLVVLALVALIAVALSRANELFCVSVRDGRCLVVRGQIPTALLQDFRDVVARAGLPRATIRGVREGEKSVRSPSVSGVSRLVSPKNICNRHL